MLRLNKKDTKLMLIVAALTVFAPFLLNPFPAESGLAQFNAGYPDLMQKFVIFGIFAIGFNILFGLTGYLSFGHAAFLGVGSYSCVWMFKLLGYNVIPGIALSIIVSGVFALLIGVLCLRRTGIYFSILTLAFAQMSFALAYSVLSNPKFNLTNGETGLQVYSDDPQVLMSESSLQVPHLFGIAMNGTYKLSVGAWEFQFNGGLQALSDVNLSVAENTVHAIIGPNGAGKSTLLNCLVGKLIPDTGTVTFKGESLLGRKPFEINQMGVSRVFQTPEIFGDLTVMENMLIPCFAHRDGAFTLNALTTVRKQTDIREQAEATLGDVNMLDKIDDHAASLSRGDKRRLEMAMCLVQEPKLLLLDEPTAGMARADTNNTIDLLKEINQKRDITMALIEHDMHVVFSLAERITVLAQGTPLVEKTPENIKGHPKVREAYLGEAQV